MTTATATHPDIIAVPPVPKMSARWNTERSVLINQIFAAFMDSDGETWITPQESMTARLNKTTNMDYLRKVLELSQVVASKNRNSKTVSLDEMLLANMIILNQRGKIKALHANRQFLPMAPLGHLDHFIGTLKVLTYERGDLIPTLGAHLRVCQAFVDAELGVGYSYGETDFCRIVERVPDRAEEVSELIRRGYRTPKKIAKALRSMSPTASVPLMEGVL